MKTAIYIEDGTVQLVITPESDFEKNAVESFESKPMDTKIFAGSFYDCRGGWVRQKEYHHPGIMSGGDLTDRSIIITTREEEVDVKLPLKVDTVLSLVNELSDIKRMELFSNFCTHCGSADSGCPCWNDE